MKPLFTLAIDAGSIYYAPGKRYTKAEVEVLEKILADKREEEAAAIRALKNYVPRQTAAAR